MMFEFSVKNMMFDFLGMFFLVVFVGFSYVIHIDVSFRFF